MKIDDNPFENWGLDPRDDKRTLTEAMRSRSRQLDKKERQKLQESWRSLVSDPVARARWIALTPPPVADAESPWAPAEELAKKEIKPGKLPGLRPTLEDSLVIPLMDDEQLYASPPFLPTLLREARLGTPGEDE